MTSDERRLLDEAFVGVVTVIRPNASLHSSVVWVERDGDDLLFNTQQGRAKERYLRLNAAVAVTVANPSNAGQWMASMGRAVLVDDVDGAQINRLSMKYLRRPVHDSQQTLPPASRLIVRVLAERIDSIGLGRGQ